MSDKSIGEEMRKVAMETLTRKFILLLLLCTVYASPLVCAMCGIL